MKGDEGSLYSVLIIDDDKLSRKGLMAITDWAKCGMKVVGDVANGKLALEFLKTYTVDLAVVDMVMPVMTGLDFIRESSRLYPNMQYVVLSFHEDFEYVQSALRLGALDYISKLRIEEDCTQSFMAVRDMLERKQARQPVQRTENGLSADAYEALCVKWRKLYWVYNSYTFARMLDQLIASGASIAQLERLTALLENDLQHAFAWTYPSPFFAKPEDTAAFLTRMREDMIATILRAPNFKMMSHCILFAAQYMQNNLAQRLKEQQLAQLVGMSRSYFSQNFRAYAGDTFGNFLRGIRMDKAKEFLLAGSSVWDTAQAVGYDDVKYFQQCFRNLIGESCSDFIRRFPTGENTMLPDKTKTSPKP